MRTLSFRSVSVALGLATVMAASVAEAQVEEGRRLFLNFGLGPTIGLTNNTTTQLKLSEEILYHLGGRFDGPAVGGAFQQSFGGGFVVLQWQFRVAYDINAYQNRDFALLVAPTFGVGLGLIPEAADPAFFNIHFGVDVRFVFARMLVGTFRAMAIDIGAGKIVIARYDLLFMFGVNL